jgi:hypothetical protein
MRQILFVVAFLVQAAAFSQDIIVSNYTGPTAFSRYEEFSISITVKNAGIVGINSYFYATPYLSTDSQWDASDVTMPGITPLELAPGQSFTETPFNTRIDVAPGTYYLIIRADYTGRITETDETNNDLVIPNITVSAPNVDFTLTSFSLDKSTYTQNDLVKPGYLLQNLGSTNAGDYIEIHFVLSTDATFSSNDTQLNRKVERLKGPDNIASDVSAAFALPTVANGNYYVIAWVDHNPSGTQRFEETNESNNIFVAPVTLQSSNVDLLITDAYVLASSPGSVQVNVTTRNNGTTGVSGYSIRARLVPEGGISWDPYMTGNSPDANDSYLGPGEQKSFFQFFSIVQPTPGTYYVELIVNESGVSEANHSNNTYIDYSHPIYIAPPPILGVAFNNLSTSGTVDDTDQQINVNLNLTNTGNTSGFYQYYSLLIKNSANTTVHSQQEYVYMDFSVGQTANKSVTLNLTSALPLGTYEISVSCAGSCNTTPSTRSISLVVSPTEYSITGTVQGEDGGTITKGKLFLYQDDGSGNVRFIQKIVPYEGSSFSFPIDTHPHTLYFIPDPVEYPDYVPTIYGKTISLQQSNFFTASANMNVTFEILKVNSLGTGPGIINGIVTFGSPSGRSDQSPTSPLSISSLPVILISSGQVVGITYTDESGFYEFKNLPRGTYQILLSVELDSPQLMDPYSVDIADKNMQLNFELRADGSYPVASQLFLPQFITLSSLADKTFGDNPFSIESTSSVGLGVILSSSDPIIASVSGNTVSIHEAGVVEIIAEQPGNNFYGAAAPVRQRLTIEKAAQVISFDALADQTSDAGSFTLSATSSSGLDITFESADDEIVSIEENVATIHKDGIVNIRARQSGNQNYHAAEDVVRSLVVNVVLGIEELDLEKHVYPNPTTDFVLLHNLEPNRVEVFDQLGRIRSDISWKENKIDFTQSEAGVYFVKFSFKDHSVFTRVVRK